MITRAPQAEELLPISLATLPLTSTVGVNIYLKTRPGEPPLLFSAAHNPIDREHFEELVHRGSDKLFIHRSDRDLYQQAVRECWESLVFDRSLPVLQRLAAVHDMTREALGEQLTLGHTDNIVQTCRHYGVTSIAVMGNDHVDMSKLQHALHHDASAATHAAKVSAYSALLGRALGLADLELGQLATGALLHDIGMLDIASVVVNKPGRLQDCERRAVQGHPGLGLQRVIDRRDLSAGVMMMIYQHHERWNGTGYPVGLSGKEIHPWSRLCSIVDLFAAMTSSRPYRQAANPQTALAVLDRGAGNEFDREMVTCWQRIVLN